jgi:hypothetical protein
MSSVQQQYTFSLNPRNKEEFQKFIPSNFPYTSEQKKLLDDNNGFVPLYNMNLSPEQANILYQHHDRILGVVSSMSSEQQESIIMQQEKEKVQKYYETISTKIGQLFTYNKQSIDPYGLIQIVNNQNSKISDEALRAFYKHLLAYTYKATASEIVNHDEVNKQLSEIKEILIKIVNQQKPL